MIDEYRSYPPQIADDVEVNEQRDSDPATFIVGSASAGRFILLGETEFRVLKLLTGRRTLPEVCEEFQKLHDAKLTLPTLNKFLGRLDATGILSGNQASIGEASHSRMSGPQFYVRWKLFNPDRLFEMTVTRLRWIWTKEFVFGTLLIFCLALFVFMIHPAELTSYAIYTVREHYLGILFAGILIGFLHEFAHGLTCKAFGGRVPEVGVLMMYYVLPALYCNVSGAYLIRKKSRRLWVILAGIYFQALVSAFALLTWFLVQPHTFVSDLAFIFFLGSVLDLLLNANPLIKLDGYYFLSQWLRLPNLMDRSNAYCRGLLKRIVFGEKDDSRVQWRRREQAIYAVFGLMSFIFTVALRIAIVLYIGAYLTDRFHIAGLMAAALLTAFYMHKTLGRIPGAIKERIMQNSRAVKDESKNPMAHSRRRRIVWLAIAIVFIAILCAPWNASIGSYGTLVPIPNREVIIRAPEDATLIEVRAQPGDIVRSGSLLGKMGNFELEEQIVQAQSELVRARADHDRLQGQFRAREEAAERAQLQLNRRRLEFDDFHSEQQQIQRRLRPGLTQAVRLVNGSSGSSLVSYPAAIAVLQADVDLFGVQLQEARTRAERSQQLYKQGILPRSEIESAEARTASISLELVRARERLKAALIEHRRKYTGTSIELEQASSDVRTENLQIELIENQLRASQELILVLESRLNLLRRKQAQFELVTPRAGTVYGEDLPRMVRRHFHQGEEICRVVDTDQLLVRIQLPEQELGDVNIGHHVRLRVRAYPARIFHGIVSKVGGESERDEHNRTTYRVELSIENPEGVLRPGMSAFARIDFGRQRIGQILMHKLTQLLRREVWML